MKLYFAGPLFCKAELLFNEKLCSEIEKIGYKVFLPQRDGVEKNKEPYLNMDQSQRRKSIFELDKAKIYESDVFLFLLDGRVPDEGACVELGLAYAYKELNSNDKKIIGYHTDSRAAFISSKLNPMIKMAIEEIFNNEKDLLIKLGSYLGI